jgi:hypothetical protein
MACVAPNRLPLGVKLRRTQFEHMLSALHLKLGHCSTQSACLKHARTGNILASKADVFQALRGTS